MSRTFRKRISRAASVLLFLALGMALLAVPVGCGSSGQSQTEKATPVITWATPAAITYGTALSPTQLDATASVPGTFDYTPASGTVLTAGAQTLSATFTPADAADYNTAAATVNLTVSKATPVIAWATPAAISYGTALGATQLDATANVPGAFVYTPASGTVLAAGTQTLSVAFTPTDATDYNTAAATVSLTVSNSSTPISRLVFVTQPSQSGIAGIALASQPQVQAQDANGNPVVNSSATVTLTAYIPQPFTNSSPPCGNSIEGALTASSLSAPISASGTASFTGVAVLNTNVVYIGASDGTHSVCSGMLVISPGTANQLVMSIQPGGRAAGSTWASQQVYIEDAYGNLVTAGPDSSVVISLSVNSGTLSGAASLEASGGIASFPGLTMSLAGDNYTLTATKAASTGGSGLLSQISNRFTINAADDPALFLSLARPITPSTFFSDNSQPSSPMSFILGRNPTGVSSNAYNSVFSQMDAAGERFARLQFTSIPAATESAPLGTINTSLTSTMTTVYDPALADADNNGIAVMPELGVWGDWSTSWTWAQNPYNQANGGPCVSPSDLFNSGPCQTTWLNYIGQVVHHWSSHPSIVAWEIFSELDNVTQSTDSEAAGFVAAAAATIDANDPWNRPITASTTIPDPSTILSSYNYWNQTLSSPALDFVSIHPYGSYSMTSPGTGNLDAQVLAAVPLLINTFHKPVLIGESGLNVNMTPGSPPVSANAYIGIQNAIWAEAVSGAMNGRALWYEDGYDLYGDGAGAFVNISNAYRNVSAPIVGFVSGVDYTGFSPIPINTTSGVTGAITGNNSTMLGWFRDVNCTYQTNWELNLIDGQSVTVTSIGGKSWAIQFFNTATGEPVANSGSTILTQNNQLIIPLPSFTMSIAFKLTAVN
jgi:hypothetical protein